MALQSLPDKLQTLQLDCWLVLLHHSLPPSATVPTRCSLSAWVGGGGVVLCLLPTPLPSPALLENSYLPVFIWHAVHVSASSEEPSVLSASAVSEVGNIEQNLQAHQCHSAPYLLFPRSQVDSKGAALLL